MAGCRRILVRVLSQWRSQGGGASAPEFFVVPFFPKTPINIGHHIPE